MSQQNNLGGGRDSHYYQQPNELTVSELLSLAASEYHDAEEYGPASMDTTSVPFQANIPLPPTSRTATTPTSSRRSSRSSPVSSRTVSPKPTTYYNPHAVKDIPTQPATLRTSTSEYATSGAPYRGDPVDSRDKSKRDRTQTTGGAVGGMTVSSSSSSVGKEETQQLLKTLQQESGALKKHVDAFSAEVKRCNNTFKSFVDVAQSFSSRTGEMESSLRRVAYDNYIQIVNRLEALSNMLLTAEANNEALSKKSEATSKQINTLTASVMANERQQSNRHKEQIQQVKDSEERIKKEHAKQLKDFEDRILAQMRQEKIEQRVTRSEVETLRTQVAELSTRERESEGCEVSVDAQEGPVTAIEISTTTTSTTPI